MVEMEFSQVRDFSEFCEQLHEIRLKFHKWDNCEKTVAIYYLMVGLPFANARFLHYALEQCITASSTPEAQQFERNANDSNFISSFMSERPSIAISLLLSHLPLLRPGNKETASCYLKTIRRVLTEFITPPCKIYNECVEIMSYVFIHPAFDKEEKKSFKHLLKQVLNKLSPENFVHSPVNEFSDESISPNPDQQHHPINGLNGTRLNRRSNSLTPVQVSSSSNENLNPTQDSWSSQENLAQPPQKPRSYSLSNDKTLLVNISALQSSSSETRLQDLQTMNNLPVMKSIVSWLKSLRLHKYSWVFNNLTYNQMLNLTEETLQAIGITKGARHKILLSITKLKERSAMLTELETDVMNGGDINNALKKLKVVLQSPLQVTQGEDLPTQFVKVMGKVCTQLLMLRQPSDECMVLFNSLCERAETLEAFSDEQKRRLNMWKVQLSKGSHPPLYNQRQPNSCTVHRTQNISYHLPTVVDTMKVSYTQKSSSYPNMQHNPTLNTHRHSVGSVQLQNQLQSIPQTSVFNVPNKNSTQFHVRFQDADTQKQQPHKITTNSIITNTANSREHNLNNLEIENSLESLCLQMMEHALGP